MLSVYLYELHKTWLLFLVMRVCLGVMIGYTMAKLHQ